MACTVQYNYLKLTCLCIVTLVSLAVRSPWWCLQRQTALSMPNYVNSRVFKWTYFFIERFTVEKQTQDTDLTLSLLACSLCITLNRVLLSNTRRETRVKTTQEIIDNTIYVHYYLKYEESLNQCPNLISPQNQKTDITENEAYLGQ